MMRNTQTDWGRVSRVGLGMMCLCCMLSCIARIAPRASALGLDALLAQTKATAAPATAVPATVTPASHPSWQPTQTSATQPSGTAPVATHSPAPGVTVQPLININEADAATLEMLPGIGPVIAERIIAYRTRHGPFAKPEDIMRVSGIAEKRYEAIAMLICVEDAGETAGAQSAPDVQAMPQPALAHALIDLNTADSEVLQTLPGIGPALAGRILALREALGAFEHVEDLLAVRGIGTKTLESLRPYLAPIENAPAPK